MNMQEFVWFFLKMRGEHEQLSVSFVLFVKWDTSTLQDLVVNENLLPNDFLQQGILGPSSPKAPGKEQF